jgi:putative FmdB family regulatory protein
MPLYLYKCEHCGSRRDILKKIAELNRMEPCGTCETLQPMVRQVAAPMVVGDYAPYDCPITGARIEGRRAHEENLKKHGCRIYEPGETEGFKNRRKAEEDAFEARIGDTVDEFIATAPPEKREALAIAEQIGITAEVTRTTPSLTA